MVPVRMTTSEGRRQRRLGPGRPVVVTALLLLAGALLACVLWVTERMAWTYEYSFTLFYLIRAGLLLALGGALTGAFLLGVVRGSGGRRRQVSLTAAFATAMTVLLLEGLFMFVPRSHNVGYTLGARVWSRYFWRDKNALGYRDEEHVRVPGKKLVACVGDSFTAGAGIARVEDRFTNLVNARCEDLHLLNLGVCAIGTRREYERLERHPLDPDAVVLQYYVNDIEGAAQRRGWRWPVFEPYADVPWWLRPVVRDSFLVNYLYWLRGHADAADYQRTLDRAFADEHVFAAHLKDLERFCDFRDRRGIQLVVVLFPHLVAPDQYREALDRIVAMFRSHDVPVVDVRELVVDLPVEQRVAHALDVHASSRVHELVAEALAQTLER